MARRQSIVGLMSLFSLACGGAVIAAPPVSGSAREDRQSAASRLVTGEAAHLQSVVDGGTAGGSYYIRMAPVDPLNGDSYGDNCAIAGSTITCNGGPQRIWFDLVIGGWAPDNLLTYQLGMSRAALASGDGAPLVLPVLACSAEAECATAFGPGARCLNAAYTECTFAWQDASRPNYHGLAIAATDNTEPIRWGATGFDQLLADPGTDVYAGSLVVDAQADSFGTYTLDFLLDVNTFLTREDGSNADLGLFTITPAVVQFPFGRCCVFQSDTCADNVTLKECNGLGGLFVQDGLDCTTPCNPDDFHGQCCLKDACVDGLTQVECVAQDGYIEFHADQDCTTPCPECKAPYTYNDPHCDDGDACTLDGCNGDMVCEHRNNWDDTTGCCDGATGYVTLIDDSNKCTLDFCDGSGPIGGRDPSTAGTAVHELLPPAPGDLDDNCSVDLVDYGLMLGCFKGPNTGNATLVCPPALRRAADLDGDNDIDLADAADLFTLMTMP